MLKLAGCICILLASSGMAYSCIYNLRMELSQSEQLLDLFTVMEGELAYSRCPLPELLLRLSRQMPQPYRQLLEQSSKQMEENQEADIPALWGQSCQKVRRQLMLSPQAYQALIRMGEAFSYTSLESSLQLLRLGQKKMAGLIDERNAEFAGKRKLYCCLSYMAGLFSIILLL